MLSRDRNRIAIAWGALWSCIRDDLEPPISGGTIMWTITIEGEADSVLYALFDAIEGYNVDVVVNSEPVGTVRVRGIQGHTLICEATDDEYYEPTGERIEIDLVDLDAIHVP